MASPRADRASPYYRPPRRRGYMNLDGHTVAGGYKLHFEAIEPTALAGATSMIDLTRKQPTVRDARILAHGHGKRIHDVVGVGVQVFEHLPEGGKEHVQRIGERV